MSARLYLGPRASGRLLLCDDGYTDDGAAYSVFAKTNLGAPAGAGGECAFYTMSLVLTHQAALTLRLTPLVDGYPAEPVVVVFGAAGVRRTENRELPISLVYRDGPVELGRFTPRGAWIQVQVETVEGMAMADFTLESLEIEYEVVRESRVAG